MYKKQLEFIKDEKGRILQRPIFNGKNGYSKYEKYVYDNNDNVIQEEIYNFSNKLLSKKLLEYDSNNKNTQSTYTYFKDKTQIVFIHTYFYDDKNNLIKETCLLQGDNQNNLQELKEKNHIYIPDITEYEYDENNNCIKTISKNYKGEIECSWENKYENNKLKTEKHITYQEGEEVENFTYEYEYINDNETKTTTTYEIFDEKNSYFTIEKIEDNKKTIQHDDGSIETYIYDKDINFPIEEIYKSDKLNYHIKNNYNDKDILESIEITGSNAIPITKKNEKFLQRPVVIKYDHYKDRLKNLLIGSPLLLTAFIAGIIGGIVISKNDLYIGICSYLFSVIVFIFFTKSIIELKKYKNRLMKYELNTAEQAIKLNNIEDDSSNFEEKKKDKYIVPVIIHFNAIEEARFKKGNKFLPDSLDLYLKGCSYTLYATRKVLNTLKNFIEIKNCWTTPLFIKRNGLFVERF